MVMEGVELAENGKLYARTRTLDKIAQALEGAVRDLIVAG